MKAIQELIISQAKHKLSNIKKEYTIAQIKHFQEKIGLNNTSNLYNYLKTHPKDLAQLQGACLNNATRYFRNPALFDILTQDYLPHLLQQPTLDIWVTACSLGDEAYSLAIAIQEMVEKTNTQTIVNILGTDLSSEAIATAQAGYTIATNLVSVDEGIRQKYFKYHQHQYYVKPVIKRYVQFATHDLFEPLGTSPLFDLIFCRNGLLYYETPHQERIIRNLHQYLKPQGTFVISEFEQMPSSCASLFSKSAKTPYMFEKK
jgi:chemotaxis methyl-accepting protein methylase